MPENEKEEVLWVTLDKLLAAKDDKTAKEMLNKLMNPKAEDAPKAKDDEACCSKSPVKPDPLKPQMIKEGDTKAERRVSRAEDEACQMEAERLIRSRMRRTRTSSKPLIGRIGSPPDEYQALDWDEMFCATLRKGLARINKPNRPGLLSRMLLAVGGFFTRMGTARPRKDPHAQFVEKLSALFSQDSDELSILLQAIQNTDPETIETLPGETVADATRRIIDSYLGAHNSAQVVMDEKMGYEAGDEEWAPTQVIVPQQERKECMGRTECLSRPITREDPKKVEKKEEKMERLGLECSVASIPPCPDNNVRLERISQLCQDVHGLGASRELRIEESKKVMGQRIEYLAGKDCLSPLEKRELEDLMALSKDGVIVAR